MKESHSFYYVHVTRHMPVETCHVERWTLDNIKTFIHWNYESEKHENKGLTYQTESCKIFITEDMRDLALGQNGVIYF